MENEIILNEFAKRFSDLINEYKSDISVIMSKLGIKSKSTIYRYLHAEMAPKVSTVKILADIYNVDPVWLMGYDVPKYQNSANGSSQLDSSLKIPLIKKLSVGLPILAQNNISNYIYIQANDFSNTPQDYFAIEVKEDNMIPILSKGDLAIVHIQNTIDSGQTAILFEKDKKDFTIKKIIKSENEIELHSINPYFPVTKYPSINDIVIIGRVIKAEVKKIFE